MTDAEAEQLRAENERLRAYMGGFVDEVERTVRHREGPKGGQSVGNFGDWASAQGSTYSALKRTARSFAEALRREERPAGWVYDDRSLCPDCNAYNLSVPNPHQRWCRQANP